MDQITRSIVIFFFGALVTHLWNRHRTRLVRLRWSDQYIRIATAGQDAAFGRVDVLYNRNPVTNLHLVTVQLQNESNSDLKDVVVNLASLEGTYILMSHGFVQGSLQVLPFTSEFYQALQTGIEHPELADSAYLRSRRDYLIPVLNRGATANFMLWVNRDDFADPKLTLACDHAGVKVVHQPPTWMMWGIPTKQATLAGLLASLAIVIVISALTPSTWIAGVSAWLVGATGSFIGWVIVKAWRWLVRLLG